MAGGIGSKLWPRTRDKAPKHFVHLLGEGTMIQNTVARLLPFFEINDIYVVTSRMYADFIEEQLPIVPKDNVIYEPFGRNTASCLSLATTILRKKYGDDLTLLAVPSDHLIQNIGEFHHNLETACEVAQELQGIVTIGIAPERPETTFGYLQQWDDSANIEKYYELGVRKCATFAEKPDKETAKRFIQSGDFLWNSGMFAFTPEVFDTALNKFLPEHAQLFKQLDRHIGKESFNGMVDYIYRQINSVSFDYGVMEKADNVYIVKGGFTWSDVGTWDELYRLSMKDARNNVLQGDVLAINSHDCFVSSNGKMIALVNVKDLVVVDSDDATLICKKEATGEVKQLIDYLRRKQISKYL